MPDPRCIMCNPEASHEQVGFCSKHALELVNGVPAEAFAIHDDTGRCSYCEAIPDGYCRHPDCPRAKVAADQSVSEVIQIATPTLVEIVTTLGEVYDDKGCAIWLRSKQFDRNEALSPPFEHSALDLYVLDRAQEVADRIDELASGSFL